MRKLTAALLVSGLVALGVLSVSAHEGEPANHSQAARTDIDDND